MPDPMTDSTPATAATVRTTASRRCLRRKIHRPHVARWHNDVETFCDGRGRAKEQR